MLYFIFRNIFFYSRFTASLLTIIADRIARVLKTPGATRTLVLDISKAFCRVWHTGLPYKFDLNGIIKMYFILLFHLMVVKYFELFCSTSHLLMCH